MKGFCTCYSVPFILFACVFPEIYMKMKDIRPGRCCVGLITGTSLLVEI